MLDKGSHDKSTSVKIHFLFAIILCLVSQLGRTQQAKSSSIIGTWVSETALHTTPDSLVKVTFDTTNKMHIRVPHRDNISEEVVTDYKLSEDGHFINTWIHSKQPDKLEIISLTEDEMQLRRSGSTRIEKYIRVKE